MPEPAATTPVAARSLRTRRRFSLGRLYLEVRRDVPAWQHVSFVLAALVFGLSVSLVILGINGVSPATAYEEFIVLTFFDRAGLGDVLVQCSPMILVGLSAALAFRVDFWNIGIEGQFFFGAIGATIIAIYDLGPESSRIYTMFLLAFVLGALWIVVPVFLKVRWGINEVITTLLLNYLAFNFVLNQVYGAWQDPVDNFHHSEKFELFERLPQLGWERVHFGIVIAVAATALVWWLMERSRFGVLARFVGTNPRMSLAVGVNVWLVVAGFAMLSGALSGAAGYVMAAAQEFRLTPSMAAGYGFSGIVIAFLSRNNAIAVLIVAFLMGGLFVAGQSIKVFHGLPHALVGLLQAIIVLSVVASDFFVRYRVRLAR
jgi:simple sugar transport system permease protein